MTTIVEALREAAKYHDAGDLGRAEQIYRQILTADRSHALATYLLGLIAHQVDKQQEAIDYFSRAIRLNGVQPLYHTKLGDALRALGRIDEATVSYRQALKLDPNFAGVHVSQGALWQAQGDLHGALGAFRRAIELAPQESEAHYRLGLLLQLQGDWAGSINALAEAVRLHPNFLDARLALGVALQAQGRAAEAREHFQFVIRVNPRAAQPHCAMGVGYQGQGDYRAAMACYQRALELNPRYAEVHFNIGTALYAMGREVEAIACFQKAIECEPSMAMAYSNLANTYLALVQPDEAVAAARKALELGGRSSMAMGNLATALQMQGDMDGAIAAFRRCVELNPNDAGNHSNLIYTLNFHPDSNDDMLFAEHLAWARQHADPITAQAAPHTNDRSPDRRLRIGYVSGHFFTHAVSFFSEPMLLAHDPKEVELFCYANVRRPDAVTDRFRHRADTWREITRISDQGVADIIRRDKIDILVDLAGHIGGNLLQVFAYKPAPIQVTYLGYQNTTGMAAMDYRITDDHADPPGLTDRYYTEKLVRLPEPFFCFAPLDPSPPVTPLPARTLGRVAFASLNNILKLTPQAFRVWARILHRVPDSRLVVLAYQEGEFERRVQQLLAAEGIDPARVDVVGKRLRYEYLSLHDYVDIALDTFPFNGHTTVCDALWMGVPSVMLEGSNYASRFGGSTLRGVGLEAHIAKSIDEYVEIAVGLASNLDALAELRSNLRERLLASSLCDAPSFTRKIEAAYRQMWRTWCQSSDGTNS